jgi:hypothetical protein
LTQPTNLRIASHQGRAIIAKQSPASLPCRSPRQGSPLD